MKQRRYQKKLFTKKVIYLTTLGLLTMGTTGASPQSTTYGLTNHSIQVNSGNFSTAFVFPATLEELVKKIEQAKEKVKEHFLFVKNTLEPCKAMDLEQAKVQALIVSEQAMTAGGAAKDAQTAHRQLIEYHTKATKDLELAKKHLNALLEEADTIQKEIKQLKNQIKSISKDDETIQTGSHQLIGYQTKTKRDLMLAKKHLNALLEEADAIQKEISVHKNKMKSVKRIYTYTLVALNKGNQSMDKTLDYLNHIEKMVKQVNQCVIEKEQSVTEGVYGEEGTVISDVYGEEDTVTTDVYGND